MLPLPSRSHPQKQNRAVYTKELTHLFDPDCPKSAATRQKQMKNEYASCLFIPASQAVKLFRQWARFAI
jgi:hypothetical protein